MGRPRQGRASDCGAGAAQTWDAGSSPRDVARLAPADRDRAGVEVTEVEYPAKWESDVVLADGGVVRLRAVRADDDAGLMGLYQRLSDESLYLRFFSPVPRPTAHQLERLVQIDYRDRMALVALSGDAIVAVARYDRVGGDEAEVAFTVDDEFQGRGLGTLMLEHLAAVARENGIRRFVADTLPTNRKMLDVFRNAGFEIERTFESGTVRVAFSIEPTEESAAAIYAREHVSEAASMARLLAPRSIAVIGAGRRPGSIGHEVFRNLIRYGFEGPVYPVNPGTNHVAGVRAFESVLNIPDDVDLAIVTVPSSAVRKVVEECAQKHVRGLVVISAGFAELGTGGRQAERELTDLARRHGMRIIGPNCLGIANTAPEVRMHATFAPYEPKPGRVAFLSQSGGLGIELMARAGQLGLGISSFVSVGNKADVSGNDLLQHWEEDPQTDVILLYLESFGNPRKFSRLARRIARKKPIVAVKGGRTIAGTRAATSHTAAMAAPDIAVDALFRQAGVIRVDTLEQLFDTAQVLSNQPLPAGPRVAILGNAGGPGILAADACEAAGLEVPELGAATQEVLRSFVAEGAAVGNPVDLVAAAAAEQFERAMRAVLADDAIDAVLVIFVPPLVTRPEDVAEALARAAGESTSAKPVVACFLGLGTVPEAFKGGAGRRPIPTFPFPESAALALGRAAQLSEWRQRPEGTVPDLPGIDVDAAHRLVHEALAGSPEGVWLAADTAIALCTCFGIPVAETRRVTDAEEAAKAAADLGFPVVLKAGAGELVHKSDVGGVRLHLGTGTDVGDAFREMRRALGDEMGDAIVQPMIAPGVETIVGVVHDPSFGPLVMFGLGGTTAELLGDRAVRILPLTDLDAQELVRSLRGSPLLFGYRGAPEADVAALEDLLLRVGRMADELAEVAEMDANPVIVSERGAIAVDVKVRLAPSVEGRPADLRRLRS